MYIVYICICRVYNQIAIHQHKQSACPPQTHFHYAMRRRRRRPTLSKHAGILQPSRMRAIDFDWEYIDRLG